MRGTWGGVAASGVEMVLVSPAARSRWRRLALLARQNPAGTAALLVIVAVALVAALAPILAPYDPAALSVGPRLAPPSSQHLFGTDNLGRDLLSRVIAGTRIALLVSVLSIGLGTTIGSFMGLVSGWFQGAADEVLQRWRARGPANQELVRQLQVGYRQLREALAN